MAETDLDVFLKSGGKITQGGTDLENFLATGGKIREPAGTINEGDQFAPPLGEISPGKSGRTVPQAVAEGAGLQEFGEFVGTTAKGLSPFEDPETGTTPIVDFAKGLGQLAAGGIEMVIPGEQGEEKFVRAMADYFGQKYGGDSPNDAFENFKIALADNSFEVASDFGMFITGIGGSLKLASLGGKVKATQKLGENMLKIANFTDPIGISLEAIGKTASARTAVNSLVKTAVNFTADPNMTPVQKLARIDTLAESFLKGDLKLKRAEIGRLDRDIKALKGKINSGIDQAMKTGKFDKVNKERLVKAFDDVIDNMKKFGLAGSAEASNKNMIVKLKRAFIKENRDQIPLNELQELKVSLNKGFKANVAEQWGQVTKTVDDRLRDVSMKIVEDSLAKQGIDAATLNKNIGIKSEIRQAIADRLLEIEKKPIIKSLGLASAGGAAALLGVTGEAGSSVQGLQFGIGAAVVAGILTSPRVQIKVAKLLAASNQRAAKAGRLAIFPRVGFQAGRFGDIKEMSDDDIMKELGFLNTTPNIPQESMFK